MAKQADTLRESRSSGGGRDVGRGARAASRDCVKQECVGRWRRFILEKLQRVASVRAVKVSEPVG
jgi:hypothetical protein